MRAETENNLQRLLQLWRQSGDVLLTASVGEVTSVDPDQRTIDIRDGEMELYGVRLNAIAGGSDSQLAVVPKVGSAVIYIPTDRSLASAFCMAFSDIDHIEVDNVRINQGENGGLININDLTAKLNGVVDALNQLKTDFNTHVHPVSGTATSAPTVPSTASAARFKASDYEDTTLTH